MKGVYWGGDFECVVDLINNGELDENKMALYGVTDSRDLF